MCDNINTDQMPLIGDIAPAFIANTTNGIIKFPQHYIGKWVVFFSHPMDFTPVCTSEFISFQTILPDLKRLNTELIGLSVGAIASHLAWFRSIYNDIKFNGHEKVNITFPVIADMDMQIAKLYGMIHHNTSDTKTVRAVFIIDPKSIIRAILYYPQTIGRNVSEIKRILIALQTNNAFNVSTPADWMPGLPVIEPSPKNTNEINKRIKNTDKDLDVQTWFFTLRKLPKTTIYDKILKQNKNN